MSNEPKKTGILDPSPYKSTHRIVVSDPTIPPEDPEKRSLRMTLGDIAAVSPSIICTPDVQVVTPTMTIVELSGMVEGSGNSLTLDLTNQPITVGQNSFIVGAAKTNVTLDSILAADTASYFGINTQAIDVDKAMYYGIWFLPPEASTADLIQLILDNVLGNPSTYEASLSFTRSAFGGSNTVTANIIMPTALHPSPTPFEAQVTAQSNRRVNATAGISDYLIAGIHSDSLRFGYASYPATGSNHDQGAIAVVPDAVVPNLTMFVAGLCLDIGQGYGELTIQPQITTAPPSFAVANTTFANNGARTDADWLDRFPEGINLPSSTVVTQPILPADIIAGTTLRIVIDPQYQGPTPVLCNVPIANDDYILLTEVGGQYGGSFIKIANGVQISQLQSSVSDLQTSVTTLTNQVVNAAQNAGDIVVYVSPPPEAGTPEPVLSGTTVYATFDDAYEYLISLPNFLRKRIVFDDRALTPPADGGASAYNWIVLGTAEKRYWLMSHNITLSTMLSYTGTPINTSPEWLLLALSISSDGLLLDKFDGVLVESPDFTPIFDLNTVYQSPGLDYPVTGQLTVQSDCNVFVTQGSLGMGYGGGVNIGQNSKVQLWLYNTNGGNLATGLTIRLDKFSHLLIYGNVYDVDDATPYLTYIMPRNLAVIEYLTSLATTPVIIYTELTPVAPAELANGVVMVRQAEDLGPIDGTGILVSSGRYVFVGDVDIAGYTIVFQDNAPCYFTGVGKARLSNHTTLLYARYLGDDFKLHIDDLELRNYSTTDALFDMANAAVKMHRGAIYSDYPGSIRTTNPLVDNTQVGSVCTLEDVCIGNSNAGLYDGQLGSPDLAVVATLTVMATSRVEILRVSGYPNLTDGLLTVYLSSEFDESGSYGHTTYILDDIKCFYRGVPTAPPIDLGGFNLSTGTPVRVFASNVRAFSSLNGYEFHVDMFKSQGAAIDPGKQMGMVLAESSVYAFLDNGAGQVDGVGTDDDGTMDRALTNVVPDTYDLSAMRAFFVSGPGAHYEYRVTARKQGVRRFHAKITGSVASATAGSVVKIGLRGFVHPDFTVRERGRRKSYTLTTANVPYPFSVEGVFALDADTGSIEPFLIGANTYDFTDVTMLVTEL